MARRNDRGMKSFFFMMVTGLLTCISGYAQEDAYLKKLTDGLLKIRKVGASSEALNETVINWSASGNPKITLMDEIKRDKNEYRGSGANRFKMNQVVTHVYNRQNTKMVSKGDYFNSTEKNVFYSAIEKTILKDCVVTYTLTGHVGEQEFVFMSFDPKTVFNVVIKINEKEFGSGKSEDGVIHLKLQKVKKDDIISFTIKNGKNSNESYVILNHNPQK